MIGNTRAITSKELIIIQVASSGEICLDDEDDNPKAILAMVRHIYGFPYDNLYGSGLPLPPLIKDLMFHVNVFAAADKYDVPSLRALVIHKFTPLMEQRYSSSQKELCTVIQRLCGPAAANFADTSLQKSAASFCSEHIRDLIKLDAFVSMLEEGEPFAGRLLTTVLRGSPDSVIKTVICQQCRLLSDDAIKKNIGRRCINNCHPNSQGTSGAFGSMGNFSTPRLEHYKDFMPL